MEDAEPNKGNAVTEDLLWGRRGEEEEGGGGGGENGN